MSIVIKGLNARLGGSASFARDSVAYNPDTGEQVVSGDPRFVAGPFGKAVMVEEGTTNLNSGPFFKTGVSGWGKGSWTTLEWLSSEYNPFSKQNGVMRLYDNDGVNKYCSKVVSISNTPHTVSVLIKILKGNINRINVGGTIRYTDSTYTDYTWNNSNTTRYDMSAIFGQGVYKLVATITPNSSKTISKYEIRISHNNIVETELLVYAVQLEAKPYPTSFTDGTRAAETLAIPTEGVLNPQEGTWEQWVYVTDVTKRQVPSHYPSVFRISRTDGGGGILVWHSSNSPNWTLETRDDNNQNTRVIVSDSYTPNGWHLFTATWKNEEAVLYIDGIRRGTIGNPRLPSGFASYAYIGGHSSASHLNTFHDSVRISSRARTDEEILAAYQSGKPLPVDEWTTLKLALDGDLDWVYYYPLKTDWTAADDYSDPDNLNRVEAYTKYNADTLKDYGYPVMLEPVVVDRDIMTGYEFADSLSRVERNINALAQGFMVLPGYQDPKVWAPGMRFDYQDANRLEMNLQILSDWAIKTAASFKRCGTFTCGEDGDIY